MFIVAAANRKFNAEKDGAVAQFCTEQMQQQEFVNRKVAIAAAKYVARKTGVMTTIVEV